MAFVDDGKRRKSMKFSEDLFRRKLSQRLRTAAKDLELTFICQLKELLAQSASVGNCAVAYPFL